MDIAIGCYSDKGLKPLNQDCYGVVIPQGSLRHTKGITLAIADGISSSDVSHEASAIAVQAFLSDYFSTPESWTVSESAQRVLNATSAWLYGRSNRKLRNRDMDYGYVCTLSAVVIKSATAHIFHIGDSRVYRLRHQILEQLTDDHRLWISSEKSYLTRAFGTTEQLDIDYRRHSLETGDILLLSTDGIHEYLHPAELKQLLHEYRDDMQQAAEAITRQALCNGSDDNLTIQLVHIISLPPASMAETLWRINELPCPPSLHDGMLFEGYRIIRSLHASHRSHVWLVQDTQQQDALRVLKTPSTDMQQDPAALERLLLEEWIAQQIQNPHVLSAPQQQGRKQSLYCITDYQPGITLAQWMAENPYPSLQTVCSLLQQIVSGLRAMHRQSILHLDLRPHNILINPQNQLTLIDFGSARVAGLREITGINSSEDILGTEQYSAPEYLQGAIGSEQSDLFSLGVIAYQLLTGQLPYGTRLAAARHPQAQQKLSYQPAARFNPAIPAWVDQVLQRAVQTDPAKRYPALSEFLLDLQQPRPANHTASATLLQRRPLLFWQTACLLLALLCLALLADTVTVCSSLTP